MESFSRRNFLSGVVATSAFSFQDETLFKISCITREQAVSADDERYWERFREAFFIHPDIIVFNNVGVNPPPRAVEEALARESRRAASDPSFVMWRQQDRELEPVVKDLAAIVGCKPEELALVPNATHGLHTVISGLKAGIDSEFIFGAEEYPRGLSAANQRARRESTKLVSLRPWNSKVDDATIVSEYSSALTARTALIVASEVTYLSGRRLPLPEINALTSGGPTLVLCDSAQSIGLLDSHAASDVTVASLHKWMMGPVGTGILVVREPHIGRIWSLHSSDENLAESVEKFRQLGTHSTAPYLALKEALELHHRLGAKTKLDRLLYLRTLIVKKLEGMPRIRFVSSLDPSKYMPFLTLEVEGVGGATVASTLMKDYRIHVTTANRAGIDGIRISPNLFTSLSEIQALVNGLQAIAQAVR